MFQLSMLNAHVMYRKSSPHPKLSFMDFMRDIIESLLFDESDADVHTKVESVARMTERHFIEKIPSTNKERPQKRCRVCWKSKIRRETRSVLLFEVPITTRTLLGKVFWNFSHQNQILKTVISEQYDTQVIAKIRINDILCYTFFLSKSRRHTGFRGIRGFHGSEVVNSTSKLQN